MKKQWMYFRISNKSIVKWGWIIFPGENGGGLKLCNSLKSPTHLEKAIFLKYYKKAQNVFKHLQHKNKDLLEFYFYIVVRNYVDNYLIFFFTKIIFPGFF